MLKQTTYESIVDKFSSPSLKNYMEVVELCTNEIEKNYNDADLHYIKSMALFGLTTLIQNADELYAAIHSEEVYHSSLRNGELMRKIESNIKLADTALKEFNVAHDIDKNIIEKHPNLRIIVEYKLTGIKYLFSRPIPAKEIQNLIFQDKKWYFVITISILSCIMTIILNIIADETTAITAFLIGMTLTILAVLFYPRENHLILNKYKKYIYKINE